jgi:hypothetical protein
MQMEDVKVIVPDAPQYLSPKAAKQWQNAYASALQQARIDYPEDASAQRRAATHAANKLLAVPAPTSADEIDALEEHQFLLRETRTAKDGKTEMRHCVTSDGRKYAHPVGKKK